MLDEEFKKILQAPVENVMFSILYKDFDSELQWVHFDYNKKENISKIKGNFSLDNYDSKTIELLLAVINDYGKYSSSELINITHKKGSPWDSVYKENENNIISKERIAEYFKNNKLANIHNTNIENIEYIGKRDNNSKLLVLPAEWDDKEDYSIYFTY